VLTEGTKPLHEMMTGMVIVAGGWSLLAGLGAWTLVGLGLFALWSRAEPVPSDRSVTRGP